MTALKKPCTTQPHGLQDDRGSAEPVQHGLFQMNAGILAKGIFYKGMAQVIAGIMDCLKADTFVMAAFTSCALFRPILVLLAGFNGKYRLAGNSILDGPALGRCSQNTRACSAAHRPYISPRPG